ncbi:hypothetical protein HanIR_Chr09g0423981 [Helianthus annuus]|nr:hypothetical protein HanIR_Chr09g0423981 [Helianthus annuus]
MEFSGCYILTPLKKILSSRFIKTNTGISISFRIQPPKCILGHDGNPISP